MNVHGIVRIWRGIKTALKQLPSCELRKSFRSTGLVTQSTMYARLRLCVAERLTERVSLVWLDTGPSSKVAETGDHAGVVEQGGPVSGARWSSHQGFVAPNFFGLEVFCHHCIVKWHDSVLLKEGEREREREREPPPFQTSLSHSLALTCSFADYQHWRSARDQD